MKKDIGNQSTIKASFIPSIKTSYVSIDND